MYISQLVVLLAIPATWPASVAAASDGSCTLIEPPGETCGVVGNLQRPVMYRFAAHGSTTSSIEECARLCGRRRFDQSAQGQYATNCKSFQYNQSSGLCKLGDRDVADSVTPSETAKTIFYDISCFDCGAFCDQPPGLQLLDNAGFEEPLIGPWSRIGTTRVEGHNSNNSISCVVTSSIRHCRLLQTVNICPGELYFYQYDYKINSPSSSSSNLDLLFYPNVAVNDPLLEIISVSVTDDPVKPGLWRTARNYVRPGIGSSSLFFAITSVSTGATVSVDNVIMSHVKSITAIPGADRLVNGGFETGKAAPWVYDGPYTHLNVISPGINSTYGIGFQQQPDPDTGYFQPISQNVTTEPGKAYLFSFDSVFSGVLVQFELIITSGQKTLTYDRTFPTGSWTISLPFVATTNKTNIALAIESTADNDTDTHTALFDNFSFAEADVNP